MYTISYMCHLVRTEMQKVKVSDLVYITSNNRYRDVSITPEVPASAYTSQDLAYNY